MEAVISRLLKTVQDLEGYQVRQTPQNLTILRRGPEGNDGFLPSRGRALRSPGIYWYYVLAKLEGSPRMRQLIYENLFYG